MGDRSIAVVDVVPDFFGSVGEGAGAAGEVWVAGREEGVLDERGTEGILQY